MKPRPVWQELAPILGPVLLTLVFALLLLLLTGCARQVPIGKPVAVVEGDGPGYIFRKVGETYHVLAENDAAYQAAYDRLCAGYICVAARIGEAWVIEVNAK